MIRVWLPVQRRGSAPAFVLKSTMNGHTIDLTEAAPRRLRSAGWDLGLSRRGLKLLPGVLLALCVFRLWLMPLSSSLWVDEMATQFVVRNGPADPSLGVAPQVPASVYYTLPRTAENFFGTSEIAQRIPSVLAMGAALWLIALIARAVIHPDAGWFAVFACLLLRDFDYQAADARPYALGTFVVCASLWFLMRWLDSARWRDGVLFAGLGALLWRVHLIFWPIYGVFAIYAVIRVMRRHTSVGWRRIAAVFTVMGICLLPVLSGALALNREAGSHVVVPPPTVADLVASLKLGLITAVCAAAAWISRWLGWPRVERTLSPGALGLILAWWLCDPICLFAFSRLTGNSVFVSRYLYVALPGTALAATAAAGAFIPARYWKALSAPAGLATLIVLGQWNHWAVAHHNSDWRGAARSVNQLSLGPDVPVICPSPFIEARPPVWQPGYPISSFLYSHLLVYRIGGKPYPFPFEDSPQVEQFATLLSAQTLSASRRFILYGGDKVVHFWQEWFSTRRELAAWRSRQLGAFGDVSVVVFEKVHSGP